MVIIKIILSAATVVVAYFLYKIVLTTLERTLSKLKQPKKMPGSLKTIIGSIIALIALMVVLGFWNISIAGLAASLGIGGIVVGLALQEPLSNFVSGMFLLLSGAVKDGDTVDISGTSGTVETITVNHTVVRTFDGKRVMIPNKTVWGETITHFWPSNIRRLEMTIGVAYDSDLEKVIRVLEESLQEEETIEKEPAPFITFEGFGASSIDFKVRFWVRRENYFDSRMNLALRIKKKFDENGIEIPFNQLDVHLKDKS